MSARRLLRAASLAYLVVLPLGLWGAVPVAGAVARPADLMLAGLVALAALAAAGWGWRLFSSGVGPRAALDAVRERTGAYGAAVALLAVFGVWAGASSIWSFHADYALAKGAGYVALALGAAGIAASGVRWDRAVDAWLVGAGAVLLVAFVGAALGPAGWAERMIYRGGSVDGLPAPRLRGPFLHPNGFGDYLVISCVLLWARWPVWTAAGGDGEGGAGARWRRAAAYGGAAALGLALALTVSTAWLAAGVLLLLWGRRLEPREPEGINGLWSWVRSLALRGAGAGLTAVTMAGLVFPLRLEVAGVRIASSGIRPRIWSDAVGAFFAAPVSGVGAAPFLAGVGDPLDPTAAPTLWDAHNAYLSLLGQFGLAGFALVAAAFWLVARVLRRPGGPRGAPDLAVVRGGGGEWPPPPVLRDRARTALLGALLAMAVHGLAIAGEDLRHWWALLGVAGVVALSRRGS